MTVFRETLQEINLEVITRKDMDKAKLYRDDTDNSNVGANNIYGNRKTIGHLRGSSQ